MMKQRQALYYIQEYIAASPHATSSLPTCFLPYTFPQARWLYSISAHFPIHFQFCMPRDS